MVTLRIGYGLDAMPDDTKDKVIAPKISRLAAPAARTYLRSENLC